MNDRVLISSKTLNLEHLNKLFDTDGQVLAIWVQEYFPLDVCKFAVQNINNGSLEFQDYENCGDLPVDKIGFTFAEISMVSSLREQYFQQARKIDEMLRNFFRPYLSPLDSVHQDLDNLWPTGLSIGRCNGKRMASGFVRRVKEGGQIPPHQDDVVEESDREPPFRPITEIVQNVYLQTPDPKGGGELIVYDVAPNYADEIGHVYDPNSGPVETLISDRVEEIRKKAERLELSPKAGDLIMFRARNIHQVNRVQNKERITTCSHIAYSGEYSPLMAWI